METKFYLLLTFLLRGIGALNFTSPCPRLFNYETKTLERDRYFGNVKVESTEELNGVWLRLLFDKPCVQLGNWLGEVSTEDNKEFLIKKRKLVLKPGDFLTVRFYVKFTQGRDIPHLTTIKVNGKTVCPEESYNNPETGVIEIYERNGNDTQETTRTTTTTTTTEIPPSPYNLIHEIELPGPSQTNKVTTEDYGEFFQGDLSIVTYKKGYEECGVVHPPPSRHHSELYEGSFPWHSAIYLSKGTELTYICSASLISPKFLLTVAHCVTKKNSEVVIRPDYLLIYLGKYYLRRWSNPAIQERQVKEIFIHDAYNHVTMDNDIALLKLWKSAKITTYVRPVCLWRGNINLENLYGESGMVVGWGFDQNGIATTQLIRAFMPVVPKETCINTYPEFYKHFATSKSYCAGFQNGTTICNGDSGGGMVFPKRSPGPINKHIYYLRGVISISVALQNEFKCDNEHYAIFTDVARYLNWIDTNKTD